MKNDLSARKGVAAALVLCVLAAVLFYTKVTIGSESRDGLNITFDGSSTVMEAEGLGMIRQTAGQITAARSIPLAGSDSRAFIWKEDTAAGEMHFYAVSVDGGAPIVRETSYKILLRFANFDPLEGQPAISEALRSPETSGSKGAYIVQFVTQPLDEYRDALASLGVKPAIYLPEHAYIVQMDPGTRARVEELPFVRWVGKYEAAYKLEEVLAEGLQRETLKPGRYNIMLLERGAEKQEALASSIRSVGGKIEGTVPEGFRIEATLTAEQLLEAAHHPDVLFIDRWSAPESDMDVVRSGGGANFIENTLGFRGEGVRAEVMDNGLRSTHGDFNSGLPVMIHNSTNTNEPSNHGTSTYGINFARGSTDIRGRGMLPEAQGIFADYDFLGTGRYAHTARLKQAPYNAVYQSNSWGSSLTTSYTTLSAELDDILFINDILILNSQSNSGTRSSRPQAWSKNVVSIGGIRHMNTESTTDDRWQSGASIGPAADGRIKPDLAHFYDAIFTTSNTSNTSYTTGFGGTSAATPITAGHFGIFFQMWHNGLFGNTTGATVFDSRPHMTTAKAIMINTAVQWDMNIAGTDITRVRQGFGRVNVENLYNLRNKMLIVDETSALTNLQTSTHVVNVGAGSDPLKITMVYADPMGNPAATRARINDLSLKVTAPDGTVYWGNNGLSTGMWSTSGGTSNIVDTVENVFIQTPAAGLWTIEVIAAEINQDARPETPGLDADFALVVSGLSPLAPTTAGVPVSGRVLSADGRGLSGVSIRITGQGIDTKVVTGPFGYYRFESIPAGTTYAVTAISKRHRFVPPTIVRPVHDEMSNVDFTAVP